MSYEKNKYRRETIQRFGVETGLPLFAETVKSIPEPHQSRFEGAPKAMYVARETRKISHIATTFDAVALGNKQQKIYEVLLKLAHPDNFEIEDKLGVAKKLESLSNEEIRHVLELEINKVVGRIFELREFGLVTFAFKRQCLRTGRIVSTWRITTEEERNKIRNAK